MTESSAIGVEAPPSAGTGLTGGAPRWGSAAVLFVLAVLSGGLTTALVHEAGSAALIGQRAVAVVTNCTGIRVRTCDASVTTALGGLINPGASLVGFTRVPEREAVRVRYRAGRAAVDTFPERALQLSFILFFGAAALAGLAGMPAVVVGRGAAIALLLLAASVVAIPLVVLSLIGVAVTGAPIVAFGGGSPSAGARAVTPRVGGRIAPDIYARVAAQPERVLVAQGVRFDLVSNRPYSVEGCYGAAGCIAGASADWRVTGTDLIATSHLLVFKTKEQAAAVRDAIERDRVLANAPAPPSGAVVVGIGDGHYASAMWMSRADGSPARADPATEPALRGLGYFNIDPAVAEVIRSKSK